MDGSLLRDAFDHHAWANLKLIDACLAIPEEQLGTSAAGTYGTIIDTIRHIVGADSWYLTAFLRDHEAIDEDAMSLAELRAESELNRDRWRAVLKRELDPSEIVVRPRSNGGESRAPSSIRLAQAIQHGTDHRSQVCTILTTLGVEPPDIDVWEFGDSQGRVELVEPTAVS